MTDVAIDTSYLRNRQTCEAEDVLIPLYDMQQAIEDWVDGLKYAMPKRVMSPATLLTIASGAVSVTQTYHLLRNAGGGSTGTLNNINAAADIDLVIFHLNGAGQTTTFAHNAGNLRFEDGRDYVMNDQNRVAIFYRNVFTDKWSALNRNTGSLWLTDSADATLSNDTLVATQSKLRLLPESGTADELRSITNPYGLDILVLATKNSGDTITLKHNAADLWLESGQDELLSDTNNELLLVRNPSTGKWTAPLMTERYAVVVSDAAGSSMAGNTLQVNDSQIVLETAPNPDILALSYTPRKLQRRWVIDQAAGGTNFASLGATFTTTGSATANDARADTDAIKITQAAVANSYASRRSGSGIFQWRWNPVFEIAFNARDISETFAFGIPLGSPLPIFAGLMSGTPTFTTSVDAGTNQTRFTINWTGVSGVVFGFYESSNFSVFVLQNGTILANSPSTNGPAPTHTLYNAVRVYAAINSNQVYAGISWAYNSLSDRRVLVSATPGALATTGLDLYVGAGHPTAGTTWLRVSRLYGEQG